MQLYINISAGDITRGKTVHTAIQIPWDSIYEKPIHNYKDAKMVWNGLFQINDEQYRVSRNNRINDGRTSQNICSILRISIVLCYNKHMRTVRQKISIS